MSRTEWGQMVDFLRSNPWCSREEYTWGMTIGQIRLAAHDFSRVDYSTKGKRETRRKGGAREQVFGSGADLRNFNDLGIPIIRNKEKGTGDNG